MVLQSLTGLNWQLLLPLLLLLTVRLVRLSLVPPTLVLATTAQGLADSAVQPGDLATVSTSGSYNDLTNKPTIPAAVPVDSVNSQTGAVVLDADDIDDTSTTHKFAISLGQLSAADSAVQPGDLSTVATTGNYSDLSGTPTIPTNNNQLTNGAGYITSVTVVTPLWMVLTPLHSSVVMPPIPRPQVT